MASLLELGVSTGKWDSGLKKAQQSLNNFVSSQGGFTQALEKNSESMTKFVSMMGNMESKAKTMRGQLSEYRNSFEQLTLAYQKLTDEEKKGEFGQALSQTLDQLKTKIADSKQSLDSMNAELGNTSKQSDETGGVLDALAGKFGLNVTQAGALGAALGVATAAVKVAKDAFFTSEQNLDDWNRTVYSAQSTYEAFLTALNTGDISGFLNNISRIVNAAKAAYDAIDWLNTQAAINNPKVKAQMAENARFDQMLKTGTYIAPAAGSGLMPTMAEGTKLTPAQLRAIQSQRANGQRTLMNYKNIELGALNNTIGRLYEEQAANLGMSRGQFMAGVADSDTFKKNLDMYNKYKAFEKAHTTTQRVETGYLGGQTRLKTVRDNAINPYAAYKGWGVFKDDGDLFKQINGYIDQRASLQSSIYSDYGQMYRTFNRVDNRLSGGGGGGSRGGGGGGGGRSGGGRGSHQETLEERAAKLVASAEETFAKTIQSNTLRFENGMDNSEDMRKKELSARERLTMAYVDAYNLTQNDEYKTAFENAAEEYRNLADVVKGKREQFEQATDELMKMSVNPMGGMLNQLLGEDMQSYAKRKGFDLNTGKGGGKKTDWAEKTSKDIDKYLSPISTISSGLQEMGVKIPEGIERMIAITQGVSTILTGISALVALIQVDTKITSAATTSDALIPFSHGGLAHAAGGLLTGHHFSMDQVPVMVNDGELILNRAQQGVIADGLRGGSPIIQIEGVISGEDIQLVQRNRNRRTGRGEYVTTKTR